MSTTLTASLPDALAPTIGDDVWAPLKATLTTAITDAFTTVLRAFLLND